MRTSCVIDPRLGRSKKIWRLGVNKNIIDRHIAPENILHKTIAISSVFCYARISLFCGRLWADRFDTNCSKVFAEPLHDLYRTCRPYNERNKESNIIRDLPSRFELIFKKGHLSASIYHYTLSALVSSAESILYDTRTTNTITSFETKTIHTWEYQLPSCAIPSEIRLLALSQHLTYTVRNYFAKLRYYVR